MFFGKKVPLVSQIPPSRFPDDLRHLLALREITLAMSGADTNVDVRGAAQTSESQAIDVKTKYIGVLHLQRHREQHVPVLLHTYPSTDDGELGRVSIYRTQGEASIKHRREEFGRAIDPCYQIDVAVGESGSGVRDLLQRCFENCVSDGRQFLHVSLILRNCDPNEIASALETDACVRLPILSLSIVDDLRLPKAPSWSYKWWHE